MSKGLKIMSLGVINHGMSLSVLYYYIDKENTQTLTLQINCQIILGILNICIKIWLSTG